MSIPFVDAHCHFSTDPVGYSDHEHGDYVGHGDVIQCIMSNNVYDLKKLNSSSGDKVVKSFGVHPWYSHLFSDKAMVDKVSHYREVLDLKEVSENEFIALCEVLPAPLNIYSYIEENFDVSRYDVIGEIGLDRLFRLPDTGYYTSTETGRLTRVKVKVAHQMLVFKELLRLSRENNLPISVHDVKCHQLLFNAIYEELKDTTVNICLHSYTGSMEMLQHFWFKKFDPSRVFLSISFFINLKKGDDIKNVLNFVPPHSILTETDYPVDLYTNEELKRELSTVYKSISDILNFTSFDNSKELVYQNFQRFLGKKL